MSTKTSGFKVFDWMVKKVGLAGNILLCYAYLYEQTCAGKETYTGSYAGISADINCTIPTVYSVLRALKNMGLVAFDTYKEITVLQPILKDSKS